MADELLSNSRKPYRISAAAPEGSIHHAVPVPAPAVAGMRSGGIPARQRGHKGIG